MCGKACVSSGENPIALYGGIACVDNFFLLREIRFRVKTLVCVNYLFLNPNLK